MSDHPWNYQSWPSSWDPPSSDDDAVNANFYHLDISDMSQNTYGNHPDFADSGTSDQGQPSPYADDASHQSTRRPSQTSSTNCYPPSTPNGDDFGYTAYPVPDNTWTHAGVVTSPFPLGEDDGGNENNTIMEDSQTVYHDEHNADERAQQYTPDRAPDPVATATGNRRPSLAGIGDWSPGDYTNSGVLVFDEEFGEAVQDHQYLSGSYGSNAQYPYSSSPTPPSGSFGSNMSSNGDYDPQTGSHQGTSHRHQTATGGDDKGRADDALRRYEKAKKQQRTAQFVDTQRKGHHRNASGSGHKKGKGGH